MNNNQSAVIKIDFNDILIKPAITTYIDSRKEINPFDNIGMLPVFTAPMDTVVGENNLNEFTNNKINVCLPRQKKYNPSLISSIIYSSISLDDFIEFYINNNKNILVTHYVLIDIANGHMVKMIDAIKKAKKIYGDKLFIMAGNIAHPDAYKELSDAGANAVRIGIGNGGGCLTTQQTGIGYPMASLIRECYYQSLSLDNPALIIADGGMKGYSDMIKAIALGADYVMVGSLLNKCIESCGETRVFKFIKLNPQSNIAKWLFKKGFKITKRFRGMSTKEVQKNWGNYNIKTSEGVVRIRPVEYTLSQWTKNFEDYLRSAMSYTNCKTLEEFRGNVEFNIISEQSFQRFNK